MQLHITEHGADYLPFLCRFYHVYYAMHNLCMAEDSICPEKYQVGDSLPSINAFPPEHPNKVNFNVYYC